jgi:hypothetical protein
VHRDEDRTRHNRVQHVVTFLHNEEGRRPGPRIKEVSIKVKYVEAPPEAYPRQELEDLFRVSNEDEEFLWRFFLGTGFRDSAAHCLGGSGSHAREGLRLLLVSPASTQSVIISWATT